MKLRFTLETQTDARLYIYGDSEGDCVAMSPRGTGFSTLNSMSVGYYLLPVVPDGIPESPTITLHRIVAIEMVEEKDNA